MILAAPLVIPFAEAVGLSVATLGMAKVADMVNEYIQENPEQSMKILSTIVPGVGIGEIFMKKGKDEEVEEEVEVEDVDARDLTKKEKAKKMKEIVKEGGNLKETMKKGYEEIILPGKEDEMLDEAEDRYDGGVEEVSKPKFDYKKFFKKRYADGGAIGIEVLFEPKRKDFNIGGNVQRVTTPQPYDPRASATDFARAIDTVGAGTDMQKARAIQNYDQNIRRMRGMGKTGFQTQTPFFSGPAFDKYSAERTRAYTESPSRLQYNLDANKAAGQFVQDKSKEMFGDNIFGKTVGILGTAASVPLAAAITPFHEAAQVVAEGRMKPVSPYSGDVANFTRAFLNEKPLLTAAQRAGGVLQSIPVIGDAVTKAGEGIYDAVQSGKDSTGLEDYLEGTKAATSTSDAGPSRDEIIQRILKEIEPGFENENSIARMYPDQFKTGLDLDYLKTLTPDEIKLTLDDAYLQGQNFEKPDFSSGRIGEGTPFFRYGPQYMEQFNMQDGPLRLSDQYTGYNLRNELGQLESILGKEGIKPYRTKLDDALISAYRGMTGDTDLQQRIFGLKDGGRVGLFMGGDPLTGQALAIYNSMNAYGFTDQQIADALAAQGLYTAGGSTPDTPDTTIQPISFQSDNGGGGGITELDPLNRPKGTPFDLNSLTKTKFGYNNALGRTIEGVKDFTGSMIDKFSGSKIGEGITSGATKFKNMAFTPMMALMQKRNPLNPNAMNYNPNLQKQMDFLEGTTGTRVFGTSDNLQFEDAAMIGRDPNSGLDKYGPGSVLSGQNVASAFGTNDYEQQLANYVEKMRTRAITKTLSKFQQQKLEAAMAELGREKARQEKDAADRARAANAGVYAELDKRTGGKGYGDAGGFSTSRAGKEGAFGTFGEGRGRKDFSEGGLATMFKEKR